MANGRQSSQSLSECVDVLDKNNCNELILSPSTLNNSFEIRPEIHIERNDSNQSCHKEEEEREEEEETEVQSSSDSSDNPHPKVVKQLKGLAEAFAKRGEEVKRRISQPLQTSSPEESLSSDFRTSIFEEEWMQNMDITRVMSLRKTALREFWHKLKRREWGTFEPQSSIYVSWLFIVSLAFVYNAVIIFLRSVFPYETNDNRSIFFTFDFTCDAIYLIDTIWFKMRLKYVLNGQWIEEPELTRKNYIQKSRFIFDILSILPLDLLYLKYGFDKPLLRLLRLNRLLKVQTFWEFFTRVDAITNFPYLIRILHTLIYKIYLIHLSTCAYYIMSSVEGFGSTSWTYNNKGNAYLRCFYFAFRTATSIGGRMPKPTNDVERIYMVISWLMGVFVFALLIGQIRDIVATATQNKTNYRNIMNQTVRYMRNLCLPQDLQKRVRLWLTYTWAQQKTFDENIILELLPLKMRTDLALYIHYHTLSRVELFKDCDRNLLRELVLKFRPVLFLPGDYICRKGEIGHEMYIVNKGQVYVMDATDKTKILATLSEGSVFGEISVLGITGFNRRTADVRSLGYSNLFVLTKTDLMETLRNYPEYQESLKEKVRKLIKGREKVDTNTKIGEIDVDCIVNPIEKPSTPRMFQTVMQIVSPDSNISQMLSRSNRSLNSQMSMMSTTSTTRTSFLTLEVPSNEILLSPDLSPNSNENTNQEKGESFIENTGHKVDNKFINDIVYQF